MSKSLTIIFAVLLGAGVCFSQSGTPAKWEKYSVPQQNVSVLLPRLPVRISRSNPCNGEETKQYGAYTNGAVYVLSVTYKIEPSFFCSQKKSFDQTNFETRLKALTSGRSGGFTQTDISKAGLEGKKLQNNKGAYYLYNDIEHHRWYELWVIGADETKAEAKNFLDSFEIEKKTTGKDIKEGAGATAGDEMADPEGTVASTPIPEESDSSGVQVVLKIPPAYTEEARKHGVSGTVVLRVKFLRNGSVGSITSVKTLPYGLTEAAITATRKMVFIPAKIKGVFTSTVKTIEHNFNIY
jgi:TonB family protein